MSRGKPQYIDGIITQDAEGQQAVGFDYDAVDKIHQQPRPQEIVGEIIHYILSETTEGNPTPHRYVNAVANRALKIGRKLGIPHGRPCRLWLSAQVDGDKEQEFMLEVALRLIFDELITPRGHTPLSVYKKKVAYKVIALTWIVSPELYDGISQRELAHKLGIHPNTLSLYATEINRAFGYRAHSQAKGWNYNPNKKSKQERRRKAREAFKTSQGSSMPSKARTRHREASNRVESQIDNTKTKRTKESF